MRICRLCGRRASCSCAFSSANVCKICAARAQGATEQDVPLDIRAELTEPTSRQERFSPNLLAAGYGFHSNSQDYFARTQSQQQGWAETGHFANEIVRSESEVHPDVVHRKAIMQSVYSKESLIFGAKLPKLQHRDELPALLNAMGLWGYGIEIGVQAGDFSRLLREQWYGDVLYLLDRWGHEPTYRDIVNVSQQEQEQLFQQVQTMFYKHPGVRIMREESLVAAPEFEDGWLDWIYLDADHLQAAVAQDLAAWWPKLKRGGLFGGHDYCDGVYHQTEFGVKSAVDAFASERGLRIETTAETDFPSWYCRKP
jgi:hypothetical protein